MKEGLVSVIMPAFNSASFIAEAIESVLLQSYNNIELIIINDGSTDTTKEIILSFSDSRIVYLEQENMGVSMARNQGLKGMKGEYFCFLDSDDVMPTNSISSRLEVFTKHNDAVFVGGAQHVFKHKVSNILKIQEPTFEGVPTEAIAMLDPSCFINCGTWLIRRSDNELRYFPQGWTHLEDACFFLRISHWGMHYSTASPAQLYRKHEGSAMWNLEGLADGYLRYIKIALPHLSISKGLVFKLKVIKIMSLSFLSMRQFRQIIKWNLRYIIAK
ncbi:glycosyltransferase family A protein [Ekhidna sp.]|uniref:glycosyltransferase family A protein n=1 Tax=Ekhidna sp. TaxID=2608089 RepID=UPI003B5B9784